MTAPAPLRILAAEASTIAAGIMLKGTGTVRIADARLDDRELAFDA